MKYFILSVAMALSVGFASAQSFPYQQQDSRHAERLEQRKARHAAFIQSMDSTILSRNYRFIPSSFQVEPAGAMRQIYNPQYEVAVRNDYIDVYIPYVKGVVPPYYLTVLNYITYDMNGYTAVQTNDGWTITFTSSLYSINKYLFTFNIYSVSGEATLNISTELYNTVTYYGTILKVY